MNIILILIILFCTVSIYCLILDAEIKGAEYMSNLTKPNKTIMSDPGDEINDHIFNK